MHGGSRPKAGPPAEGAYRGWTLFIPIFANGPTGGKCDVMYVVFGGMLPFARMHYVSSSMRG